MPGPKKIHQILGRFDVPLLLDYLKQHGIELNVDPEKLPSRGCGHKLLASLLELSDDEVQRIVPTIFEMTLVSNELGLTSFLNSARRAGYDIAEDISGYTTFESKILHIARHYPSIWSECRHIAEFAAQKNKRGWKTYTGFPPGEIDGLEQKMQPFQKLVADSYHRQDTRGKLSRIEHQPIPGEADYFFIRMDDHQLNALQVTKEDDIVDAPFHPGFEIVFMHDRKTGQLTLLAEGGRAVHEPLRKAYSEVMHEMSPPSLREEPVPYDLNCLLDVHKRFDFDPDDGIKSVFLKKLFLEPVSRNGRGFSVEGNPELGPRDTYVAFQKEYQKELSPMNFHVSRADFLIKFVKGKLPKNQVSFFVGDPCRDDFKNEQIVIQNLIRKYLKKWGIDVAESRAKVDLAA